jgi:hypothetical protein
MWITCRKQPAGWRPAHSQSAVSARIRRITNSNSSEPAAPPSGRFAAISLWVENLPADADLNYLGIEIGSLPGVPTYIGPPELDGLQQVNAILPPGLDTGLHPVRVFLENEPICAPGVIRILPRPPAVPRVTAVTDGINLMSGARLITGTVKVVIEEAAEPETFAATIAGVPAKIDDIFCCDPRTPRHEINFHVPSGLPPGTHRLDMTLGRHPLAPVTVEVVPAASASSTSTTESPSR